METFSGKCFYYCIFPVLFINLISILKMRGVCKSAYTISMYMCQIYLFMHFPEKAPERKSEFVALHANANFSLDCLFGIRFALNCYLLSSHSTNAPSTTNKL